MSKLGDVDGVPAMAEHLSSLVICLMGLTVVSAGMAVALLG